MGNAGIWNRSRAHSSNTTWSALILEETRQCQRLEQLDAFKVLGRVADVQFRRSCRRPSRDLRMPSTTLWHGYYSKRRPSIRDRSERVGNDVENVDHPSAEGGSSKGILELIRRR